MIEMDVRITLVAQSKKPMPDEINAFVKCLNCNHIISDVVTETETLRGGMYEIIISFDVFQYERAHRGGIAAIREAFAETFDGE